jgi:RNA-directed DNA polymerase
MAEVADTRQELCLYLPPNKALVAVMARVKTLCRQSKNLPLSVLLHRLNRMLRGWTTYFNYGCSHATFIYLRSYLWKQVVRWQERKHRRTAWKQLRRRYGGRPADGGVELFDPAQVRAKRYCCCILVLPGYQAIEFPLRPMLVEEVRTQHHNPETRLT